MALAAYCYGEKRFQGWTKDFEAETAQGLQFMSRALELASVIAKAMTAPDVILMSGP